VVRRHDYFPFGEEYAATPGADARRFTGKERDAETGLDYFGARYYASRTGRFTTVDPVVLLDAAFRDPQLWNRYAYVRNNPLRYTDPDGRCIWDLCAAEGTGVYLVGAAAVATTAWLISPPGQEAVRQVVNDTGMIITTAADAIGSWFRSEARGEPPQLKAGKEAHKNEEVRPGEQPEVRTPSGKGRMDRYDADKAHIREIKPDNARGERTGRRALERYKKEMDDATKRPHTTELTKYPKRPDPREPK
jgi:RHS repeat-associated protein